MTTQALLLNADYMPLQVITWKRAVCLLLEGQARMVKDYTGRLVRSTQLAMPWPAVLALKRCVPRRKNLAFSRKNVLARDGYRCSYCSARPLTRAGRPDLGALNLDHVIPRAQAMDGRVILPGGKIRPVTCWENITTSCVECNSRKGPRSPSEAGMRLTRWPRVPTAMDAVRMAMVEIDLPDEWKEFVPREWRGYWSDELWE